MAKEKIEGLNIWLPESIGDKLIGIVKKIENDGQFGIQAVIKKDDGKEILTPSHKWLQNCLRQMSIGDEIEIEFTGEEAPKVKGQSPTKKYNVYRLNKA